jgi:hypothetical protein
LASTSKCKRAQWKRLTWRSQNPSYSILRTLTTLSMLIAFLDQTSTFNHTCRAMAARSLAENSTRAADEYTPVSDGPVEDVIPFLACFCCISSCYYTFPGCIGYSGRQELLCCRSEYLGCKIPTKEENVWCHWSQGHTYCATVDTLFKVKRTSIKAAMYERCVRCALSNDRNCSAWTSAARYLSQTTSLRRSPVASSR